MERSGGFYNAGPFTPFLYHAAGAAPKSTLIFSRQWRPELGRDGRRSDDGVTCMCRRTTWGWWGWMEDKDPKGNYGSGNGSPQLYDRGSVDGPGPYHTFSAAVKDENGKTVGTWPCRNRRGRDCLR